MKKITDLELKDKKVLVRADLNVPLNDNLEVTNNNRILGVVPTIKHLKNAGAKVAIASHLGRPKGEPEAKYSLKSVSDELSKTTGYKVVFSADCIASDNQEKLASQADDEILLLENVRFHAGEKAGDEEFAKKLAAMADVYVNDAFGTAHRADASVATVAKLFTEKAPGFLMQKELDYYEKAMLKPERPLAVVLGGAKVSTKLPILVNLAEKADMIFIGGAMANTFIAAEGCNVGKSLYEPDMFAEVNQLKAKLEANNCQLFLPVDFSLGEAFDKPASNKIVSKDEIDSNLSALDIGPESVKLFAKELAKAKTIVWNGPMGAFENPDFAAGTLGITEAIANCEALSIVGGGDTVAAVEQMGLKDKFDFLSTGGGAFLSLLEGAEMPAINALD